MRVLMFGWEFPPHISGGLGTACLGLTQSLVKENVNVVFVVPKLLGDETAGQLKLVNASNVIIPIDPPENSIPEKQHFQILSTSDNKKKKKQLPRVRHTSLKKSSTLNYIEIESSLNPYEVAPSGARQHQVEKWNYVFDESTEKEGQAELSQKSEFAERTQPVGYTYSFSGTYGSRLLEEVEQFALAGVEIARKFPHDVIHAHDWMTFAAGIAAKQISGMPLVVHVHATEVDRSGYAGGPVFEYEKHGMEMADKIVAVSQWTKDILVSKYSISAEKIEVVHNGIFPSEPLNIPKTPTAPIQGPSHFVTFLGRVTYQKGPAYFVEAARKVALQFPEAHFIVAGSGDLLPQIIERVAQLRMSHKFHFTGFLTKEWMKKIWSLSNVYVMPSVSEPFGITPLEAIQAGVPVIVSNQSGVAEVMPHALKVNFWDTEALADSICSILKYKSLSSMLKNRGEKEIKHLSWSNAARKLKTLYEELTPTQS